MEVDPSGTPERSGHSPLAILARIVVVFLLLPAAAMLAVKWLLP